MTTRSSYDFFRSLVQQRLIQDFKSVYTNRARYLMLAKAGVRPVAGRRPRRGPCPHPSLSPEPQERATPGCASLGSIRHGRTAHGPIRIGRPQRSATNATIGGFAMNSSQNGLSPSDGCNVTSIHRKSRNPARSNAAAWVSGFR